MAETSEQKELNQGLCNSPHDLHIMSYENSHPDIVSFYWECSMCPYRQFPTDQELDIYDQGVKHGKQDMKAVIIHNIFRSGVPDV